MQWTFIHQTFDSTDIFRSQTKCLVCWKCPLVAKSPKGGVLGDRFQPDNNNNDNTLIYCLHQCCLITRQWFFVFFFVFFFFFFRLYDGCLTWKTQASEPTSCSDIGTDKKTRRMYMRDVEWKSRLYQKRRKWMWRRLNTDQRTFYSNRQVHFPIRTVNWESAVII